MGAPYNQGVAHIIFWGSEYVQGAFGVLGVPRMVLANPYKKGAEPKPNA